MEIKRKLGRLTTKAETEDATTLFSGVGQDVSMFFNQCFR